MDKEKETVKEVKNDKKVRKLLAKKEFPVDPFQGPFDQNGLSKYISSSYGIEMSISESLYQVYKDNWLEACEPLLINICNEEIQNGTPQDEIEEILSNDLFLPIKAKVLLELRK